ncbi:MAG: hypothetical protein K8U57_31660 [Planctomycetes bacterium]|nr:hypothetical protein [Planctomycetota bacterium]
MGEDFLIAEAEMLCDVVVVVKIQSRPADDLSLRQQTGFGSRHFTNCTLRAIHGIRL